MPRTRIGYYAASPLARHPSLLLRKMRDRLSGPARFSFEEPPAGVHLRYPESLAPQLRAWAAACQLHGRSYPSHRVFHQDFGRAELLHLCRTGPVSRPDLRGDIKLIWEFSRGQAYSLDAVRGLADAGAVAIELREWIDHNGNPDGPNWTNPMEVGIRAVNWICADALANGAISAALGRDLWISNLWNSGRAIFQRLEARLICSNHYLADLLGLLYIGAVLGRGDWREFAAKEFPRALETQTFADGGLYEASLPYHALVTEMALLFTLLARHPPARLPLMCQALADLTGADGEVFQVGDNDGGRIIPIDFVSALGRAEVLLKLAAQVLHTSTARRAHAFYPESGWWIAREGDWTAMLELGGVGLAGAGSHAHNDSLSVSVLWKGQAVLVDPGSFLYSPDPAARNRLRSTTAHNVMMVNGVEQLPLPGRTPHDLFSLPGPTKTAVVTGLQAGAIAAKHETWTRSLRVAPDGVRIVDEFTSTEPQEISWFFHFHPSAKIRECDGALEIKLERGGVLTLRPSTPGLALEITKAEYSPFYGTVLPAPCVRFSTKLPRPGKTEFFLESR